MPPSSQTKTSSATGKAGHRQRGDQQRVPDALPHHDRVRTVAPAVCDTCLTAAGPALRLPSAQFDCTPRKQAEVDGALQIFSAGDVRAGDAVN